MKEIRNGIILIIVGGILIASNIAFSRRFVIIVPISLIIIGLILILKGKRQKSNTGDSAVAPENTSATASSAPSAPADEEKHVYIPPTPKYTVKGIINENLVNLGSRITIKNSDYEIRNLFFNDGCWNLCWKAEMSVHRGASMGGDGEERLDEFYLEKNKINTFQDFLDSLYSNFSECLDIAKKDERLMCFLENLFNEIHPLQDEHNKSNIDSEIENIIMQRNSENLNTNMSLQVATSAIRNMIIEKLKKSIEDSEFYCYTGEYAFICLYNNELAILIERFLWNDAKKILGDDWDCLDMILCLESRKIFFDCSTYPGTGGRTKETQYAIDCESFHEKAVMYNLSDVYCALRTESDWDMIFNDELNDLLIKAKNMHDEKACKE